MVRVPPLAFVICASANSAFTPLLVEQRFPLVHSNLIQLLQISWPMAVGVASVLLIVATKRLFAISALPTSKHVPGLWTTLSGYYSKLLV